MSFEQEITLMTALRSRFPDATTLRRLVARFDPDTLYALLQASPISEELYSHLPQRTSEGLVARGLRIVADGAERIRHEMVERLGEERDLALFWVAEGVIRALRYHAAKGFERERRYRFNPLIGRQVIAQKWSQSLDLDGFAALLHEGEHPLAPAIDVALLRENREEGERAVEQYLFSTVIPRLTARHPATAPFFGDRADLINGRTLLLASGDTKEKLDPARWYIDGGGRLTPPLFRELRRAERKEVMERLAHLFGLTPPDDVTVVAPFARQIKRTLLRRQFRRGVEDPLGANRILWFLNEFDNIFADLRTTLIFGASSAPVEEAGALFLGRAA